MMRVLAMMVVVFVSGCAYVPGEIGSVEEGVRARVVDSSLLYLCKKIRMEDWQRVFGQNVNRITAWAVMCAETDSPPPPVKPSSSPENPELNL